jgi:tetratricopeptide (TPR) repeat protein
VGSWLADSTSPVSDHPERGSADYGSALDHAIARTLHAAPSIAAESRRAPALLAEILQRPDTQRDAAVATDSRFRTYSLAAYSLEMSEKAVSRDLAFALTLARLARTITSQVDPRTCGGMDSLADLGAYTLAIVGNIQRVSGCWPTALAAFGRSREIQKRRGADPDLMARIDLLESSLRRDLGQPGKAEALLRRAEGIFIDLQDEERCTFIQINRANLELVQKAPDRAIAILEGSLATATNPQHTLLIRHNLTWALTQAGQTHEASALYLETQELYTRFSDPLFAGRRLWLEGLLANESGQTQRAESLLKEAGSALEAHGYAFDAALAHLDLGKILAQGSGEPRYVS